ncbi:MAG: chorismate mutase [Candidatus Baldrarchaeia archaeon]
MDSNLMKELKDLRSKIMKLTLEIIRLSGERLTLAKKIGEIKAQNNMPIEDPLVEQELRRKVIDLSQKHNIDVNFSLKLLNFLIEESKRVQRNNVMLRKYKRHM